MPEETPGPPLLRVGISIDQPPFAFVENVRRVGIEVDLARMLAGALDMRLRAIELLPEDQVPALLDHRVDVIMGMTVNASRELLVFFTEPYLRSELVGITRRGDVKKLTTIEAIRRSTAKIGVVRNTLADGFVRETFPAATVYAYSTVADAIADLREQRADVYIGDAATSSWFTTRYESEIVISSRPGGPQERFAWALRRGDLDLQSWVGEVLDGWRRDGTLDMVLDRWLPSLARSAPSSPRPRPSPLAPDSIPQRHSPSGTPGSYRPGPPALSGPTSSELRTDVERVRFRVDSGSSRIVRL